jgi:hypothetical protein
MPPDAGDVMTWTVEDSRALRIAGVESVLPSSRMTSSASLGNALRVEVTARAIVPSPFRTGRMTLNRGIVPHAPFTARGRVD